MSLSIPPVKSRFDRVVYIDFETYYSTEFGLRRLTTEAYVRDPRFEVIGCGVADGPGPARWLTPAQFFEWLQTIDWSRTAACAHHAQFDGLILSHLYKVVPAFWFDTLSMSRAMFGQIGNGLADLAERLGLGAKGHEVADAKGKRRKDFTPEEYARYGAYCANDVELCRAALRKLAPAFPDREFWHIDTTIRMFTEPAFVLDETRMREYQAWEISRKQGLLDRVQKERRDLTSGANLAGLLFEHGVDAPTKPSPSTGEPIYAFAKSDAGMQALLEHPKDEVRWLAEARLAVSSNINETRTARFLAMGAGGRRIPVYLKYSGAHTHRWAGGDKVNFQNLERTDDSNPTKGVLRQSLMAPPGKEIVVVDSTAIEARGVAWFAGSTELVNAFANNLDLYSEFASVVYGRKVNRKFKAPDGTVPDYIPGLVGKVSILGLGYGMGFAKFADTLLKGPMGAPPVVFGPKDLEQIGGSVDEVFSDDKWGKIRRRQFDKIQSRLTREELEIHCAVCYSIVRRYRETYPEIPRAWKTCAQILQMMHAGQQVEVGPAGCGLRTSKDALHLPSGLSLRYPELKWKPPAEDDEGEDAMGGFSYYAGKTAGRTRIYGGSFFENITQALARIVVADQTLAVRTQYGYPVVSMTHDEAVFLVPEGEGEMAYKRALAEFKRAPEWAPTWPLNAEGGWGIRYGDVK